MLWQNKRQQSREVLRTVFVCHRVPFLIPQAPVMPAGAACGGGSRCKARLRRFSCCSESGVGDGRARKPVWFLKSRTTSREHKLHSLLRLIALKGNFRKVFVIIKYLQGRGFWWRDNSKHRRERERERGHNCTQRAGGWKISLKAWWKKVVITWLHRLFEEQFFRLVQPW